MFDQNMLYLTIGGVMGFIIGSAVTVAYYRFLGLRFREKRLQEQIRELKQRLKAKDELIKKAVRAVKDEANRNSGSN